MHRLAIARTGAVALGLFVSQAAAQNVVQDPTLQISDPDDIVAVCGGDPDAGMPLFEASCAACHTLLEGEPHLEGPNLYALYGRTAGTAEGFDYSDAMIAAGETGLVWGRETLQPYFQDVQAIVPGTSHPQMPEMVDTTYRTDLMTYVRLTTTPPPPALEDVTVPPEVLALDGDIAYGEYLSAECAACHVPDGQSAGGVPQINGLSREDLMLALYQYRTGARDNSTMMSVAASLGDEEIASLAAYFSQN